MGMGETKGQKRLRRCWVNSTVSFGPYTWRVLARENGRALLMTEDIIERRAYNDTAPATWETCSLRAYLNGEEFKKNFKEEEWDQIGLEELDNPKNSEYGTAGGERTTDRVFLLSIQEALQYFGASKRERMAKSDGIFYWWWLRSPGYSQERAANVQVIGDIDLYGEPVNSLYGVRPALWLNLES